MQLVLQALIHMWKLTLVQLILERENKAAVAKDLPRDMTLLSLLREQIFVSKARAVLSARILTALAGYGYVPTGSATSIVFRNTPANSYLVFVNDDHSSGDRTAKIGQIVFDNEILGYWTTSSRTVDFSYSR